MQEPARTAGVRWGEPCGKPCTQASGVPALRFTSLEDSSSPTVTLPRMHRISCGPRSWAAQGRVAGAGGAREDRGLTSVLLLLLGENPGLGTPFGDDASALRWRRCTPWHLLWNGKCAALFDKIQIPPTSFCVLPQCEPACAVKPNFMLEPRLNLRTFSGLQRAVVNISRFQQ